jgi:HTH-type transcriptional regulator, transcriptional repressor of NAD biosynthesis genes
MKIAILGAECTGKTSLIQALAAACELRGQTVQCATEVLREWCDANGRTPAAYEQILIAHAQAQRVLQAPACDVLLADTTPLMTAIYSDIVLNDRSLYPFAVAHHAVYDLVLLTGLDLPWVADGIQRDGKAMQRQIDARLREVLQGYGLHYSVVYGAHGQRCANALAAIDQCAATRALGPHPKISALSPWQWTCEKCSDAQCEHHLFTTLMAASTGR